jgi:hypothetical protein
LSFPGPAQPSVLPIHALFSAAIQAHLTMPSLLTEMGFC